MFALKEMQKREKMVIGKEVVVVAALMFQRRRGASLVSTLGLFACAFHPKGLSLLLFVGSGAAHHMLVFLGPPFRDKGTPYSFWECGGGQWRGPMNILCYMYTPFIFDRLAK